MKVGAGGGVKSVQSGNVYLSDSNTDITISEVNVDKAVIRLTSLMGSWKGQASGSATTGQTNVRHSFLSGTQIRITRAVLGASYPTVNWEVIEYA